MGHTGVKKAPHANAFLVHSNGVSLGPVHNLDQVGVSEHVPEAARSKQLRVATGAEDEYLTGGHTNLGDGNHSSTFVQDRVLTISLTWMRPRRGSVTPSMSTAMGFGPWAMILSTAAAHEDTSVITDVLDRTSFREAVAAAETDSVEYDDLNEDHVEDKAVHDGDGAVMRDTRWRPTERSRCCHMINFHKFLSANLVSFFYC